MKIRMWLLPGVIFAALFGTPTVWAADLSEPESPTDLRFYLSIAGGWNHADSDNFHLSSGQISGEIFFDDGWIGKVALGANIDDHLRGELEFAIRNNDLDHETIDQFGKIDLKGETNVYTGLAKIAYDFGDGPVRPFVGAGIGVASFDVNIDAPVSGSDSDLALAGSLSVGMNFAVSTNAELFAEGEALLIDDVSLDPTSTGSASLSNPLFLSASLGLRYRF
jgi:opacity protein-like surface antigen